MNAYDSSNPLTQQSGGLIDGFRFHFGVDEAKVAAQLRALADAIERREVVVTGDGNGKVDITVEEISFETTAKRDDFTYTKITILLAEQRRVT